MPSAMPFFSSGRTVIRELIVRIEKDKRMKRKKITVILAGLLITIAAGTAAAGWQYDEAVLHYYHEDGTMARNEIIDGKFIWSDGSVLGSEPEQAKVSEAANSGAEDFYGDWQDYKYVTCNEYITLRANPSTKAAEICKIPNSQEIEPLAPAENGFLKARYNEKEGYVLFGMLNKNKPQLQRGTALTVVNCKESITLRVMPNSKSGEIMQIPKGGKVTDLGRTQNGFNWVSYEVKEKGKNNVYIGWAMSSYLQGGYPKIDQLKEKLGIND